MSSATRHFVGHYRGHGWRANTEMSASMFLPTFAVIGLLGAGLVTDIGVLMIAEHVAMLLSMLGAMLLRPAEYTCGVDARGGRELGLGVAS
jgi:hypothetical protein